MIYSMTAYAEYEIYTHWGSVRFELKSFNHRYLELSFRLPENLKDLETPLRDIARRHLGRGKVDCALQFLELRDSNEGLTIDLVLVERLVAQCKKIQELLPESTPISPLDILKWPKVIKSADLNSDLVQEPILEGFHKAIEELLKKRAEEGMALAILIKERLEKMESLVDSVRKRIPVVIQGYRERLLTRLKSVSEEYDADRLEQELVYALAKLDVEEELDRLATHVKATLDSLETGGAVGRRLDFLMQELNREANTLASKSIDSEVTESAIELKVLIEQMREQIQNLV